VAEKILPLRSSVSSVVQDFWFSVFGFPFWLLASGFAASICANQRKSAAEKILPLRSSVSSVVQGFWFSVFGFPSASCLLLCDTLFFLQPCWEGCRTKQHQNVARVNADC
jgi:hypothetical protein